VVVTIDVLNTGDMPGTYIAELRINGSIEDTREVNLAGGASMTVSLQVAKDTAGEYAAEIGGQTGTFAVSNPGAVAEEGGQTGTFTVSNPGAVVNWSLIGGIIAAVMVMGISGTFLFIRRRGGA